ncbi:MULTISPECIES: SRPBCC domain-containing protein [unclassified Pseudonocardia]|uniref:SRPBCC domain-containing protein n=1 Tax=unclassified Pseudonocardia TaxID=2619320 RepID=UPI0001FFE9C3|nr:SRPBCC domain-containing protein [Pseudonocardia sp. Ae707_Ps1]OLM09039.1 hypothetical protein Ae707Ps1_5986c [Pseudonocardia sp. Ae707_Ps1]
MTALGTLSITTDGRCALRFERRLAHPQDKVWRALTQIEHLRWWFAEVLDYDQSRFDAALGAELGFVPTAEHAAIGTSHGRVTQVEAPTLLEYTWGSELLRWELEADGAGCRLVFTNIFDDRGFAPAMGAGWHAGLERLHDYLDDRAPDQATLEIDPAAWERLQADYERALA